MATRLEYPFTIRPLSDEEGGGYVLEFPDLAGCMADGETPEEAIREGQDALRSWIQTQHQLDRPIPPPSRPETYSGKWQMRVPKSIHRRLAERAKVEGVSLNTLVVTLISEGLGQRERRD